MTEDEKLWHDDRLSKGWTLARKAPRPLRAWGIRHIRWAWLSYRVHQAAEACAEFGIGMGRPNQRDLWVLYAVYRGWC